MLLEGKPDTPPTDHGPAATPPPNSTRRAITAARAVGAAALCGVLLFFGTGLDPVPWLTWMALLPVLVLAPRTSARVAAAAAFGAWLGGGANLWSYLLAVHLPVPLVVAYALLPAALFAGFVLLVRTLLLHGWPLLTSLVAPGAWIAVEYLFSVLTPDGAFWSLAYTQSDLLTVMQTASLTGPWGITYLLVGAGTAIAAGTAATIAPRRRLRAVAAYLAVVAATAGYGVLRLDDTLTGPRTPVALVVVPQSGGRIESTSQEGRAMLTRYQEAVRRAIASGARVVVLPETVFAVDEQDLPGLTAPFLALARRTGATVVLGVGVKDHAATRPSGVNSAQVLTPDGARQYVKQHLITGAEAKYRSGHDLTFASATIGVQICKDLDFPALTRAYRAHGAALVVAPAHDVGQDGWLHSRIAVSRGIENGIGVARAARDGRATITDSRGRVLADVDTSGDGAAARVVSAPLPSDPQAPTLYAWAGDWFAWLGLAATVALLLLATRRPLPDGAARRPRRVGSGRAESGRLP